MRMNLLCLLLSLASVSALVPLTVKVPANERRCFYTRAHKPGAKIRAAFTVMAGGSFDIDATLVNPDGSIFEKADKSEGQEWLFNAPEAGDYQLCFYNEMSTVTDKTVQFEFEVETVAFEARPPPPANDKVANDMDQYVNTIDRHASAISQQLAYLKVRNARNESTVLSTSNRVWWYTIIEVVGVILIAVFNVTIVQVFFNGSRKTIV